eukprot:2508474-Pyramimonas_sp.AAC.1
MSSSAICLPFASLFAGPRGPIHGAAVDFTPSWAFASMKIVPTLNVFACVLKSRHYSCRSA